MIRRIPFRQRLAGLPKRWLAFTWLVVVWVALWGELSLANVLGGAAVAIIIGLVFPLPPLPATPRFRLWSIVVLAAVFVRDLTVASFQVALLAWRPGPPFKVSVVRTNVATTSEATLTLVAEMTSLVPGTIVLETNSASRTMYLHCLDVSTPEEVEDIRVMVASLDQRVRAAFSAPTASASTTSAPTTSAPTTGAPQPPEEDAR